MAIIFTKTLAEDKWLFSDNNNIVEFSDDTARVAIYTDVTISGTIQIRLFPLPDGTFWFNLKQYISTILNDYDDDLDFLSIDTDDIQNFIFDWAKGFLNTSVQFVMTFSNAETEQVILNPNFIIGVEQIEDYFNQLTIFDKDVTLLSPLRDKTKIKHYVKYWEGYPFDIGFTKSISNPANNVTKITNLSNGISTPDFVSPASVHRIAIDSGELNLTIEDHLSLRVGFNLLKFDDNNFLELEKIDAICGTYIRWMNQYGTFNYWLFEFNQDAFSSKSLGDITNDYFNIAESKSPNRSLGRTSTQVKTLVYEDLNTQDINILKGIIESPRISLYTGQLFAPNPNGLNWIDVSMRNKNIVSNNFKDRIPNGSITINLPDRYTIKL